MQIADAHHFESENKREYYVFMIFAVFILSSLTTFSF